MHQVQISVRIKPETYERIKEISKSKEISYGALLDEIFSKKQALNQLPDTSSSKGVLVYLLPIEHHNSLMCANGMHKNIEG